MVTRPVKRPRKAVRLTFSYGADGIRLIDKTKVEKRAPPSSPEPATRSRSLTAELRSASNEATYRQAIDQGLPPDVEVFDPERTRGVFRDPSPPSSGAFSIVVPDDSSAEEVVLLAPPPQRRRRGGPKAKALTAAPEAPEPPAVVARFRLKE
jgi:hypothetical protein